MIILGIFIGVLITLFAIWWADIDEKRAMEEQEDENFWEGKHIEMINDLKEIKNILYDNRNIWQKKARKN